MVTWKSWDGLSSACQRTWDCGRGNGWTERIGYTQDEPRRSQKEGCPSRCISNAMVPMVPTVPTPTRYGAADLRWSLPWTVALSCPWHCRVPTLPRGLGSGRWARAPVVRGPCGCVGIVIGRRPVPTTMARARGVCVRFVSGRHTSNGFHAIFTASPWTCSDQTRAPVAFSSVFESERRRCGVACVMRRGNLSVVGRRARPLPARMWMNCDWSTGSAPVSVPMGGPAQIW